MTEHITCIECPMGCAIEADLEDGKVTSVRGNRCPRGKAYAESEVTCPVRVLTTTVRTKNGQMLPVKTSKPIRKASLFSVMQAIREIHPEEAVHIGDVLVRGIDGDADLIVTGNAM